MKIDTLASMCLSAGTDILAARKGQEFPDGSTVGNPSPAILGALGGRMTSSGRHVTPDSAMQSTIVNACVRVYAESVATVPLIVYKRSGDQRARAAKNALYAVLHDKANPYQSSFEWRELMERDRCLRGNGYSLIERDGRGRVSALYRLNPDRVEVLVGKDRLPYYKCRELSGNPVLSQEQVFHLRNSSRDGYCGLSYIAEAADAVGLTLTLEEFGASLFANGAMNRGFFSYAGSLTEEQFNRLRESIAGRFSGRDNFNRPGVLDGGWTWIPTSMKAEEAQFLESRNYQVEDIARLFRMPSIMIGHADKTATFASAEQFFLAFVKFTLMPVTKRWEQALRRSLFILPADENYYPEFLLDGLLRGDVPTRYAAYAVARQWGWLNVDEIRGMENLNPLPDGKGQTYLEPLNMIEAGTDRSTLPKPPGGDGSKTAAYIDLLASVIRHSKDNLEQAGDEHA